MEFDSVRMRSSMLIGHPDGSVVLYSKGADSTMLPRCRNVAPASSGQGPWIQT
jgi:magnesium-transporting ATPase (P-type)